MTDGSATATSGLERRLHRWLDAAAPSMLLLLEELVNIDSGSSDRDGIAAVAAALEAFLRRHQVRVERIGAANGLDLLHTTTVIPAAKEGVLLLGHMDTVFPAGTAAKRPFVRSDGRFFGPGVADMKAGLAMNACLIAAFQACADGDGLPVSALFTVDEEVGSSNSRPHIEALARQQRLVLNSEPARTNGDIVIERKGGVFFRIEARGVAAHSGVDIQTGASAIEEILHKAQAIYAIGRETEGVTANVGLISGGTAINTVPDHAFLLADIRFSKPSHLQPIVDQLQDIVRRRVVDRTSVDFAVIGQFNPMEWNRQNEAAAAIYLAAARELGVHVGTQATGGCSDAGFSSSLGVPTLCGVGPVGGAAHTADEYVVADSVLIRAKIAATTTIRAIESKQVRS